MHNEEASRPTEAVDWDFLRAEGNAEEGSFLLALRAELRWDRERFSKLEREMRLACQQLQGAQFLDRWLVTAFWAWTDFIPSWSGHPHFPRPDDEYYEACITRLTDLAFWFFDGLSPYVDTHEWEDL